MEIANCWASAATSSEGARVAREEDVGAITGLLRDAPYSHIHADWHHPSEWLGIPSFVVVPKIKNGSKMGSLTEKLFQSSSLSACLAVVADPRPKAWVRLAAVGESARGRELLAAMLLEIYQPLRETAVSQIAWLLVDEWPETWLRGLGFEKINEVVTYVKQDSAIPPVLHPRGLKIRPVESSDIGALAAIEARAFEPLWQHSRAAIALAKKQAFSFDVACLDGIPVGFQFSSTTRRGAHLSRITVDVTAQRSGIGRALLAHALNNFYRQGITTITLNTQLDNIASQRLYEQFGFRQNGERFPVWSIKIA